jgi:hypothetical protein
VTAIAAAASSNSNVSAGVVGFLVVAGLGLALFFLLRSMNKQFKKLPPPGDSGQPDGPGGKRPRAGLAAYRAAQAAQRAQGGDRANGRDVNAGAGTGTGQGGGRPGRS